MLSLRLILYNLVHLYSVISFGANIFPATKVCPLAFSLFDIAIAIPNNSSFNVWLLPMPLFPDTFVPSWHD